MTSNIKEYFLFLVLIILSLEAIGQKNEIPVKYYLSTLDYRKKEKNEENAIAVLYDQGNQYLHVEKFIKADTRKAAPKAANAYVIDYAGSHYVNLQYAPNLPMLGFFLKIAEEGRYCMAYSTSSFIRSHNSIAYTVDIQSKIWLDSTGGKNVIAFINTDWVEVENVYGEKNSGVYLLTTSMVKKLPGVTLSKEEIRSMTFEQVVALIKDLNVQYVEERKKQKTTN